MELSDKQRTNPNMTNTNANGFVLNLTKIKNIGKASVEIANGDLLIKSFESGYTFRKPVETIDYLAYSKGNVFLEDKIYIGISGEEFDIACKENEYEFKNFYDNLVNIRESKNSGNNYNNNNTIKTINKSSNNKFSDNISKSKFNHTLDEQIEESNTEEKVVNSSEEIRNFYNLMKEGIISEEEFEEKKKELLNS